MAETAKLENVTALQKMAGTWLELAEQLLNGERQASTGQNAPLTEKVQ
jgi:hypothetical protein